MIRFEQDPRGAIEEIIREDVRADMHGDLYGVDRAADAIMVYVDQLQVEIALLKAKLERLEDEINDQSTYI
jgi:uncharacterized small protein (DUF1192 family)